MNRGVFNYTLSFSTGNGSKRKECFSDQMFLENISIPELLECQLSRLEFTF